jgi:hypothetical protein
LGYRKRGGLVNILHWGRARGKTYALIGLLKANNDTILLVLNQKRKVSVQSILSDNILNKDENEKLMDRVFTYEEWRVSRGMEHKNYCLLLDDVDEYLNSTLCYGTSTIGTITMTDE